MSPKSATLPSTKHCCRQVFNLLHSAEVLTPENCKLTVDFLWLFVTKEMVGGCVKAVQGKNRPLDKAEEQLRKMWNATSADDAVISSEKELSPDSPVDESESNNNDDIKVESEENGGEEEELDKDAKLLANLLSKTTKLPIEQNGTPVLKGLRECGLASLKEAKTLEKHRRKLETEKRRSEAHEFAMRHHFEQAEATSDALISITDVVDMYPCWMSTG